ncbi:arsenite efflux transporter metallochaperone ArsD [Paenibacillus monticola]|uniref:Arsenite efflux transporter metallochaperone ArsD n=1 Tax=Paenibacillus monticola TaxID=2666075 RepID=A0A7X2H378_9BACL|nr:arsenite efflux transporter metallochaperone ArsD [Paenibacillus monticola]MRN52727.1 arsenite efflux transporter metallochaperone ArsD [Paenibacillus monticola]
MKSIEIYDPAMCCSTGVCGPSVDPELIRISAVVHNLKKKEINVSRYNLSNEPEAFVANEVVKQLLTDEGPDVLPVIIVDGQVVKKQSYPSNEELEEWTGIPAVELIMKPRIRLELKVKSQ